MLKQGFTFVAGRSTEKAKRLIDAARQVGLDSSVVRTKEGGYVVPNVVFDELNSATWVAPQEEAPQALSEQPPEPPSEEVVEEEKVEESTGVDDFTSLKLKELQAEAERRNLPTYGSKAVLIDRLTNEESE